MLFHCCTTHVDCCKETKLHTESTATVSSCFSVFCFIPSHMCGRIQAVYRARNASVEFGALPYTVCPAAADAAMAAVIQYRRTC